uniref:Senescence domain-containing protein n=2 Tax=Aegilops tauschii subsp. strangulata TaxID=200361 RepID=A0A453K621_AEGTS
PHLSLSCDSSPPQPHTPAVSPRSSDSCHRQACSGALPPSATFSPPAGFNARAHQQPSPAARVSGAVAPLTLAVRERRRREEEEVRCQMFGGRAKFHATVAAAALGQQQHQAAEYRELGACSRGASPTAAMAPTHPAHSGGSRLIPHCLLQPRDLKSCKSKVWDAVEVSGKNVMQTSSVVTTSVLTHRYGDQAREITQDYINATRNALQPPKTLFKQER